MNSSRQALHIDWTRCDGRGLCTELLEAALTRDDWGFPVSRRGDPAARSDVPLRANELEDAQEAVAMCPLLALRLVPAGTSEGNTRPTTERSGRRDRLTQ